MTHIAKAGDYGKIANKFFLSIKDLIRYMTFMMLRFKDDIITIEYAEE